MWLDLLSNVFKKFSERRTKRRCANTVNSIVIHDHDEILFLGYSVYIILTIYFRQFTMIFWGFILTLPVVICQMLQVSLGGFTSFLVFDQLVLN